MRASVGARGRRARVMETEGELYKGLFAVWKGHNEAFGDLVGKYETYRLRCVRRDQEVVPFHRWDPVASRANVTEEQLLMLNFNTCCDTEPRVYVDGVQFRPDDLQLDLKTDDSGVVVDFQNPLTQDMETWYGRLLAIYRHKLYDGEGSPELAVAEVKWFEVLDSEGAFGGRAAVVRSNDHLPDNQGHLRFVSCVRILPEHAVFWKLKAWDEGCEKLVVISRSLGRTFKARKKEYSV